MSQNANHFTEGRALHYLLMPGDGTAYRFSILPFNADFQRVRAVTDNPNAILVTGNYVMDSGVNQNCEEFVKLAIDMPGGVGLGTVPLSMLSSNDLGIDYLKTHGFGAVDPYTLVAVLLAVKVLATGYHQTPEKLTEAAAAMLEAPHYLRSIKKAAEDYFEDSNDHEAFLVDGGDQ